MVGADGLDSDHETLPDIDSLWNYDGPADTERRFAKLLPRAKATADASYLAQLLTQIARAQGLKGNINEELAECLLLLGRAGEARSHFARAYELLSSDEWLAKREHERLDRLKRLSEES
jgi:predicted Zn-dependent protease